MPGKFMIDDNMFIFPKAIEDPSLVDIFRGSNIGAPPTNDPFPADIKGTATIKVGDKITTDHIIPAGARMKYRSNVPNTPSLCSRRLMQGFLHAPDRFAMQAATISLSAARAMEKAHRVNMRPFAHVPRRQVVLAKSFQRIHTDNLVNFGISSHYL